MAISGINFKGEVVSAKDLINSQGSFTKPSVQENQPDTFEKSGEKKSHKGAVIGLTLALLAAAYVGLGFAVGKGNLKAVEGTELKFMEKVQNFFHQIGKSGENLWNKVRGNKA